MPRAGAYDDAVIGAGILGLASAFELARRGRRVIVLERRPRACGASVRNFGMLWPIGQPLGPMRTLARRSLELWLEVLSASGLWHDRCGSLHLAYRDDEAQVLREFTRECADCDQSLDLLAADRVCNRVPAVKREGLQLGLWSPHEVCVDPRQVVAGLPAWLAARFAVEFRFDCTVTRVEAPTITTSAGRITANRVWVCCGDELGLLYPDELATHGLIRCKLQMMRSQPSALARRIGPMLAAGLTLRHYQSFQNCPSLPALKARVAHESPWFDRFGIHVMVSQNGLGELTIGDSHEFGAEIEPFDKTLIDEWILSYLTTFLDVPELQITSRWHGTYAKHPTRPYLVIEPAPRVTVITGVGGAGMTLSFGLAEQIVAAALDGAGGVSERT